MEENLDKNNEADKEIFDNTTKSNSAETKEPKSEKVISMEINNGNSESNSASKLLKEMKLILPPKLLLNHKKNPQ